MLDRSPMGVIYVDEEGKSVFVNRAARKMVAENDGLVVADDRIGLARRSDNKRLQALIAAVLKAPKGSGPDGLMLAARPSGKRPYTISIFSPMRLPPSSPAAGDTVRVCVMVADPESEYGIPVEKLGELYGLTPAEARLALCLASGKDLRAAAEELGIAYPTARAQLASIFRKTDTSRQAELVRLLVSVRPLLGE